MPSYHLQTLRGLAVVPFQSVKVAFFCVADQHLQHPLPKSAGAKASSAQCSPLVPTVLVPICVLQCLFYSCIFSAPMLSGTLFCQLSMHILHFFSKLEYSSLRSSHPATKKPTLSLTAVSWWLRVDTIKFTF